MEPVRPLEQSPTLAIPAARTEVMPPMANVGNFETQPRMEATEAAETVQNSRLSRLGNRIAQSSVGLKVGDTVTRFGKSRVGSYVGSVVSRTGDVLDEAKTDYRESEQKAGLIASGLGTVAVQLADRARVSVIFVPEIATNVLEDTHSPLRAGIAGGAAFGIWCLGVGGFTTEGLRHYPRGMEAFKRKFPAFVEGFQDALPGVDDYSKKDETKIEEDATSIENTLPEDATHNIEDQNITNKRSIARKIGSPLLTGMSRGWTRLRRGNTVVGIGTVAYVSTAAADGDTRKSTHILNANASVDGGAVAGTAIYGITEWISHIDDPELAQNIIDVAGNSKFWLGVAGVSMASQLASSRSKKRKNQKLEESKDVFEPYIPTVSSANTTVSNGPYIGQYLSPTRY